MFQTQVIDKLKPQISCSKSLFRKSCRFELLFKKYDTAKKGYG